MNKSVSKPQIEYRSCYGWQRCLHIHNDTIELFVTTEVGPRIIHFGFVGQENEFAIFPEMIGQTKGDEWRIYGGHRLWHAPEDPVRTYWPDNFPVQVEQHQNFVRFIQPIEGNTGIVKEMDIALHPTAAQVQVTHRLINHNLWAITLAPWAMSVMAAGGVAILPLPPRGKHPRDLLPSSSLTLWPYTNMADPRWIWGQHCIMLRQQPGNAIAQKIGAFVPDGWVAYARGGHLFIKRFDVNPQATYPDMGSTVELFTNADMLEVETLGPLTSIPPGDTVEHVEHWQLLDGIKLPASETDCTKTILPLLQE